MSPTRRSPSIVAVALLAAALGDPSSAQTLDRVVPAAGSPRDLVIFRGSGLDVTTHVRFVASVGAGSGTASLVQSVDVVPDSVAPGEVRARVPAVGTFAGCEASPGSWAYGNVELVGAFPSAFPAPVFFYMEEPGSGVASAGLGQTYGLAGNRAVTSFDVLQGPPRVPLFGSPTGYLPGCQPEQGNPDFVLTLENAPASSLAVLVVGTNLAPPYIALGDGVLVLDAAEPFLLLLAVTDADGVARLPLPVPDDLGATVAFQWGVLDASTSAFAISSALLADL